MDKGAKALGLVQGLSPPPRGSGEILGAMLMIEHNLWFYQRLMQELRDAIGTA